MKVNESQRRVVISKIGSPAIGLTNLQRLNLPSSHLISRALLRYSQTNRTDYVIEADEIGRQKVKDENSALIFYNNSGWLDLEGNLFVTFAQNGLAVVLEGNRIKIIGDPGNIDKSVIPLFSAAKERLVPILFPRPIPDDHSLASSQTDLEREWQTIVSNQFRNSVLADLLLVSNGLKHRNAILTIEPEMAPLVFQWIRNQKLEGKQMTEVTRGKAFGFLQVRDVLGRYEIPDVFIANTCIYIEALVKILSTLVA